jgi:hypothetical protein
MSTDYHSVLGLARNASTDVRSETYTTIVCEFLSCLSYGQLCQAALQCDCDKVQDIKKAYKKIVKQCHPDTHGASSQHEKNQAAQRFKAR